MSSNWCGLCNNIKKTSRKIFVKKPRRKVKLFIGSLEGWGSFKKEKDLAFIRVKKFIGGALAPHCLDLDLNDRKTRHSF